MALMKTALAAVPAAPIAASSYGMYEAGSVRIERPLLPVPNLPDAFDGLRVAFLTDIHHGPYISLDYVTSLVRTTLALSPDLILLGGDYSSQESRYIGPCFEVLASLKAPLGVHGVLGNHDYVDGLSQSLAGFRREALVGVEAGGHLGHLRVELGDAVGGVVGRGHVDCPVETVGFDPRPGQVAGELPQIDRLRFCVVALEKVRREVLGAVA